MLSSWVAFTSQGFPSPFGVRVLKLWNNTDKYVDELLFPSPFGVRVLKFGLAVILLIVLPLSVPFRGSCSEILSVSASTVLAGMSFRPLSGFVF